MEHIKWIQFFPCLVRWKKKPLWFSQTLWDLKALVLEVKDMQLFSPQNLASDLEEGKTKVINWEELVIWLK